MSFASLFIGYARASCSVESVKATIEHILGPDIVDRVDEALKKDTKGYDFKMFFIHFKATSTQLEHTYKRISKEGFVAFVYDTEWDRRKWCERTQEYGAYVQRYWKVTLYVKKDKPATIEPHIMTAEEVALICPPKHTNTEHKDIDVDPEAKRAKVTKPIENMFAALALEEGEVVE
jgi:hypothetical protein